MNLVKLNLLTILFYFSANVFAQKEFAPIGTKWYYSVGAVDDEDGLNQNLNCITVTSVADTIINGENVRKLEVNQIKPDRSVVTISNEFIKQSGGSISYFNKNLNQFIELYNFDLLTQDTIFVHLQQTKVTPGFFTDSVIGFSYVIDSVDSMLIGNAWHKRQFIRDNPNIESNWGMTYINELETTDFLIEGYGSTVYLFGFAKNTTPENRPTLLRCIEYNGNVIYKNSIWDEACDLTKLYNNLHPLNESNIDITLYPNPAQKVLNIHQNHTQELHVKILTLHGEVVCEQESNKPIEIGYLSPGLYIVQLSSQDFSIAYHLKFLKE